MLRAASVVWRWKGWAWGWEFSGRSSTHRAWRGSVDGASSEKAGQVSSDVWRAGHYLIGQGFQAFSRGSYSKNVRLYGLRGLCHNFSPLRYKSSHRCYVSGWAELCSYSFIYRNRQWARFGLWAAVCQPLLYGVGCHWCNVIRLFPFFTHFLKVYWTLTVSQIEEKFLQSCCLQSIVAGRVNYKGLTGPMMDGNDGSCGHREEP